jgi:predicted NUDIX family NTP pyrophosphohydrolase
VAKQASGRTARQSAGLLVFRTADENTAGESPPGPAIEVLLVHPGGPFWAKKDTGAWSIPKGEIEDGGVDGGDPYACARREFAEELGQRPPNGEPVDLGEVRQSGGKVVRAWALRSSAGEIKAGVVTSNEVVIEWPKGSGREISFPEVDRAEWVSPETARAKLIPAQVTLLERLLAILGAS